MWQQSLLGKVQVLTWKAGAADVGFQKHALDKLDELVAPAPGQSWIIDAAEIPLLSSEAIALLIGVVRRVTLAGGRIALARTAPSVSTVLRMTRLTKILPLYDDLEQAAAALG